MKYLQTENSLKGDKKSWDIEGLKENLKENTNESFNQSMSELMDE